MSKMNAADPTKEDVPACDTTAEEPLFPRYALASVCIAISSAWIMAVVSS